MTLQLLHSEFPDIWGKFSFLFYQSWEAGSTAFWTCVKVLHVFSGKKYGVSAPNFRGFLAQISGIYPGRRNFPTFWENFFNTSGKIENAPRYLRVVPRETAGPMVKISQGQNTTRWRGSLKGSWEFGNIVYLTSNACTDFQTKYLSCVTIPLKTYEGRHNS